MTHDTHTHIHDPDPPRAREIVSVIARKYGLTAEEISRERHNRAVVAAFYEIVQELHKAGLSHARIAQATRRTKDAVSNAFCGRGKRSWLLYRENPKSPYVAAGQFVYIRKNNVIRLRQYHSMTGAGIPTLVNRAVAKMLGAV